MKKLMLVLMIMFSFMFAGQAHAVHIGADGMLTGNPANFSGAQPLVAAALVIGAAYLMYTDEVQACDSLPSKTVTAKGGGYSYEISGCETVK